MKTMTISLLRLIAGASDKFFVSFVIKYVLSFVHPFFVVLFATFASFFKKSKSVSLNDKLQSMILKKGLYVLYFHSNKKEPMKILKKGKAKLAPFYNDVASGFKPCILLTIGKPTKSQIERFFTINELPHTRKIYILKIASKDITPDLIKSMKYTALAKVCTIEKEIEVRAKIVSLKLKQLKHSCHYIRNSMFVVTTAVLFQFSKNLIRTYLFLYIFNPWLCTEFNAGLQDYFSMYINYFH